MDRESKAHGDAGSDTSAGRFIAPWRALKGQARRFKAGAPTPEPRLHPDAGKKKQPPTALQLAHWSTFQEEQRLPWQKEDLSRLGVGAPQIRQTSESIQACTRMLRERTGERLGEWLAPVEQQGVAELQSVAQGLRKDDDAVKAGLTLPWSQGPTEGQVQRLKLLKRQADGRASFQTLRKRVLRCG